MEDTLRIGGLPMVRLRARDPPAAGPAFLEATVLPGRGMMLLQARLRLASGAVVDALSAPDPGAAAREFDGGADDFAGNRSFSFGGAILAPYANRIRGRGVEGAREIDTTVAGRALRLPRNWGGKAPAAEQYAMHGLILDAAVPWRQDAPERVSGRLEAGDFGGRWPGRAVLEFDWRLEGGALALQVTAQNAGDDPLPMGIGWHPYFALPSGDRRQARLRLPARSRALVNDYDEVLPTGALQPVAGGSYDFSEPGGRALGGAYLDDCFTDLEREGGLAMAEIRDPASDLGLRIASPSQQVRAMQVYAPPDKAFVVVEPQFNLADPYGAEWGGRDTGMALIPAGDSVTYDARVTAFALENR
ncbi:aldose 1-epimerase [Phenylobacterium sp.]|jgi:galactose mutarotase-like enzyme|uniref:aldose 1-epimerase n=1 Tax=Phenylobacterium sp. TaxID=1871053 RepID=UPI002E331C18|nr:aldose 1-epimerase [Phenylobacterium sp.]HEX4712134.1 aldose 1-epimerase [Phenylobacterium sp.]